MAEVFARMNKQEEESLATITQHMTEKKEQMVAEADEAFRAKLAEAFSAMLQPGSKKTT